MVAPVLRQHGSEEEEDAEPGVLAVGRHTPTIGARLGSAQVTAAIYSERHMATTAGREVEALFRAPLAEFTLARDSLAARLRKAGHSEAATTVRRLRKPTVPVWTVNQLAATDAARIKQLLEAVDQLRRAHFTDAETIRRATRNQREALHRLLERAEALLADAGLTASPQVLGRVSSTLLGAAADPETRTALLAGRVTEELQAPGFDALAAAAPPTSKPEPAPDPAREKQAARARRDEAARARQATQAAQAEARSLRRRADELERTAAEEREAAEKAARAVETMKRQLTELERRAEAERHAADEAEHAAARAREEAERAAARRDSPRAGG